MDGPRLYSRRRFARYGIVGGLFLGAGVWWLRRAPRDFVGAEGWPVLAALRMGEAQIFAAIAARLLDPGAVAGAALPDPVDAVGFLDRFLALAHPATRTEVRALIAAFDRIGPLSARIPGRFTRIDADRQDLVLRRWERGPRPLAMGFTALKQLAYMAHYRRDASWPALGYGGPIVPRGYEAGEQGWFDPAWLAPPGDARADAPPETGRSGP